MTTYQKIPGPFLRDPATNLLTEEWSSPELAALQFADWVFTEKIDGTNIRVIWDGHRVTFAGRTDNAQIPQPLLDFLELKFGGEIRETFFEQKFGEANVVLYGEGFGPKIQNGGKYSSEVSFILFDVRVEGMYLLRENIEDVSDYFQVLVVPRVHPQKIGSRANLHEGIDLVAAGLKSQFGDFKAEGLVAVTRVGLLDRRGKRIIVKIKGVDFEDKPER